jgi:hypothetical protein
LIFQLFGLQNFSLKTAMKSSTSKFPSVFYFLIIILWICYASFFLHSWYDDMLDFLNSTNNFLNRVIIIVGFTNYFNVIFIGVFYTIWDNSKLVDFHRKFQRTLNLCFSELHRRAKLRGIKKSLIFTFVFFGWSCSIYVYEICFIYKLDNTTFLLIAKIYTLVVILRFNVYVQLINYRLEVLCQLIQDNLESELNVKFQCVSILRSYRHNLIERRKIVTMRKWPKSSIRRWHSWFLFKSSQPHLKWSTLSTFSTISSGEVWICGVSLCSFGFGDSLVITDHNLQQNESKPIFT